MTQDRFSLLRSILKTIGLSEEAVNDIVDRIADWLTDKNDEQGQGEIEYPFFVRDDFLSAAEHSFYLVLKTTVADTALICPKVSLGDFFFCEIR